MADCVLSGPAGGPDSVDIEKAERRAKAEWLRQIQMEVALKMEAEERRLECDRGLALKDMAFGLLKHAREIEAEKRILDFDPKQGGKYYNRLYYVHNVDTFNHDEESPLLPMRYTDRVYEDNCKLSEAVNIFSVKIASSDVGFPLHVCGTVIARDSLDRKCVYLFRRDSDHCQLINSEEESLIKDHQGQEDRELGKGVLRIEGITRRASKKCELESCSLATRLSTVVSCEKCSGGYYCN